MPRIVRDFWIEAEVDGQVSPIEGGMRDKGQVTTAIEIEGVANANGELVLDMVGNGFVHHVTTVR